MNITAEEKMMYDVMKAIYESGIPVNFKGSMVLKACLIEAGYPEDTRHTVDIDGNWNSDIPPSADQMVESLQKAIDKSGIELKIKQARCIFCCSEPVFRCIFCIRNRFRNKIIANYHTT